MAYSETCAYMYAVGVMVMHTVALPHCGLQRDMRLRHAGLRRGTEATAKAKAKAKPSVIMPEPTPAPLQPKPTHAHELNYKAKPAPDYTCKIEPNPNRLSVIGSPTTAGDQNSMP